MTFRANESIDEGMAFACRKLLSPRTFSRDEIELGRNWLEDFSLKWGPVVSGYPTWHPLVSAGNSDPSDTTTTPGRQCGYEGLDHVVLFRNAFITCPYSDGEKTINSVRKIQFPSCVHVECERIDIKLYQPNTPPIAVTCKWLYRDQSDFTISQRCAVALMIEREIACWKNAQVGETWETMRPYFLGTPCGSKSSLFVNQQTGQALKKVWEAIVFSGVFGPVKVDR